MNEDRIKGAADKASGSIKETLGDVTGDSSKQAEGFMDKAAGTARNTFGQAKDAANDAAQALSGKAGELGQKAQDAMEDAGPLLDRVGHKATEYGREARHAVAAGAHGAAHVVRGYPLVTLGLVAIVSFLAGRVSAPDPKPWYRRDWQ